MIMLFIKQFDSKNPNWTDDLVGDVSDVQFNKMFFEMQKRYFIDVLQRQGFVLLRDVYDALGLQITKTSCVFGWVKEISNTIDFHYYPKNDKSEGFELKFRCYPILNFLESEESMNIKEEKDYEFNKERSNRTS